MSIVQISKIIHRSGNIDALPQLDGAEFGLAVDYNSVPGTALNRLFIGPVVPVVSNSAPLANNIEILTQYSTISKTANGNSSISIPVANGNINMSVAGNANIVVVTGTGVNINGNAYVSGNIAIPSIGITSQLLYNNNGNIAAATNIGVDNVTGQLISNVVAPISPFVITSTAVVNNLNAFRVGNTITFDVTGGANPVVSYDGSTTLQVDYHTVGAAQSAGTNYYATGISDVANITGINPTIGTIYGSWSVPAGSTFQTDPITIVPRTFATLPATPPAGTRSFVTDSVQAASTNFGAILTGGGTNFVPTYYDGTNWIIG